MAVHADLISQHHAQEVAEVDSAVAVEVVSEETEVAEVDSAVAEVDSAVAVGVVSEETEVAEADSVVAEVDSAVAVEVSEVIEVVAVVVDHIQEQKPLFE